MFSLTYANYHSGEDISQRTSAKIHFFYNLDKFSNFFNNTSSSIGVDIFGGACAPPFCAVQRL